MTAAEFVEMCKDYAANKRKCTIEFVTKGKDDAEGGRWVHAAKVSGVVHQMIALALEATYPGERLRCCDSPDEGLVYVTLHSAGVSAPRPMRPLPWP
jgi:hypothetical protein